MLRQDDHWLAISEFADAFRKASDGDRIRMIEVEPLRVHPLHALFAAIVEDLCDEVGQPYPVWTATAVNPEPYLAWPISSNAGMEALRQSTKPTYARHNVFVPGNLLSRA